MSLLLKVLPCHFLERLVPGQLLRQSGHALGAALEPPVSGPLSAAGAEDVAIVALVDPLGRVADVRAVDARQLLLDGVLDVRAGDVLAPGRDDELLDPVSDIYKFEFPANFYITKFEFYLPVIFR